MSWLPTLMSFAEDLLEWGRQHGRRGMPWQQMKAGRLNAYWVWVSEVMLQQTQVQTVHAYFLAFVRRFPDRASLAQATLDEVLSAWSGLGYYRRARNLHAAACQLELHYLPDEWPSTREAWEALPGLGRSTAAAIVASCFNQHEAILDGNVKRVLSRQVCAEHPWGSAALDRILWKEAQTRLPHDPDFMPLYTQSLMDLGAIVCLPKRPDCLHCPVRSHCQAFEKGQSLEFPRPKPAKTRPVRTARWMVLVQPKLVNGEFELGLQQQPEQGIWAGLWSFPRLDPQAAEPKGWSHWESFHHDFSHFRLVVDLWIPTPILKGQEWSSCSFEVQDSELLGIEGPSPVFKPMTDWLRQGIPSPVRQILLKLAKSFKA
ncbi:MAG: A/G-specific adenine glycosylase [Bordetella sp.]